MNNDDEYKNVQKKVFSHNLQYYMKLLGISQKDLMRDLHLPSATISSWVNGQRMPRMDKIQLLADYMHISKSDLIEEVILGRFDTEKEASDYTDALNKIFSKMQTNETLSKEENTLIEKFFADFEHTYDMPYIPVGTGDYKNDPRNKITKKIERDEPLTPEEKEYFSQNREQFLQAPLDHLQQTTAALKERLTSYYDELNETGQKEADKIVVDVAGKAAQQAKASVELLTQIPKYRKN